MRLETSSSLVPPPGEPRFPRSSRAIGRRSQLWLRSLVTGEVRSLRDTGGATYPFWSPDSQSLGFFTGSELRRLDLDSGSARRLAFTPVGAGGTWNREGIIVFSPSSDLPLHRVPAAGAEAEQLPFELANAARLMRRP